MSFSFNRFLSVMRSCAGIGIAVALMLCSTELRAQSKKVTIVSSETTVGQVLKDIEAQTGYLFVYNTADIDVSRRVKAEFRDTEVSRVLENVLSANNVKWHLEGRYIKILKLDSGTAKAKPGSSGGGYLYKRNSIRDGW